MKQAGKKWMDKKKILPGLAFVLLFAVLAVSSFSGEKIRYDEEVNAFFEGEQQEQRGIGKTHELSKGIYSVTVTYEASSTNHTVTAESHKKPKAVRCDAVCLERGKKQETFTVWIRENVNDFQIKINYLGIGNIRISKLLVEERTVGRINRLFCTLLAASVLLGGLIGCFYWKTLKRIIDWRVLACLIFIVAFSSIPLLGDRIYRGHDSIYHFLRIEGIAQGLKSGQFPVRIQPNWLHGYGYAVSIMYGEALLYFPAALRLLGFSIQTAYKTYVVAVNLMTAGISYFCFKTMFQDKQISLAGSTLYTLAPYRLVNIYVRAAVGEFSAMLFLPLIIMGFWSLLYESTEKKRMWPFLIGFTGLLQTHLISCEMVGIFSILFCLMFIKRIFIKENLKILFQAAIGTIALNLWFLIPFLEYMSKETLNANTEVLSGVMIQGRGSDLKSLMTPLIDVSQNTAPIGIPTGIGLGLLFSLIFLCITLVIKSKNSGGRRVGFCLSGLSVFSLLLATHYWPYDKCVQNGLVFIGTIQFPWRFLSIAAMLISTGGCLALYRMKKRDLRGWRFAMLLLVGGTLLSGGYLLSTFMQHGGFFYCYENQNEQYHVSGAEYLPADVTYNEASFHPLEPQGEQMDITAYEKKYNRVTVTCRNLLDQENVVNVPILLYRGYKAYDRDTKVNFPMTRMETGMTAVYLPAQYEGTFIMRFCEPLWWRAAEVISLCMFCILVAGRVYAGYKRNSQEK